MEMGQYQDSNATAEQKGCHNNPLESLPKTKNMNNKDSGNAKTDNQRSSIPRQEENHDEKSKQGKTTKQTKTVRKNITIIGDSILNGLEEAGMQKDYNAKVKAHLGATTRDTIDRINQCVTIHSGTNDLTRGIDTIENMKFIIEETRQESPHT